MKYTIQLDDVFEGPMDLLVYLVKKHEVDIYDIPIALITDQYLKYIEWLKAMNVDFAGDFIVMAATLTQIKSKMLLPVHESENDDPRMEIVQPILEYLQIKSVAKQLSERDFLGRDVFICPSNKRNFSVSKENETIQVGLFELIKAFKDIPDKTHSEHKIDIAEDKVSVKDKIAELTDILKKRKSITFNELFFDNTSKNEIALTFLAILEMAKLCLIKIVQHLQNGIIKLFFICDEQQYQTYY